MPGHGSNSSTLNHALINGILFSELPEIFQLVSQGADVNAFDERGFSALHYAAQQNLCEKTRFLLDHGADPNLVTRSNELDLNELLTPLLIVSGSRLFDDKLPILSLLIGRGACPNIPDVNGVTPVIKLIASSSRVEEVEFLCSSGADVNIADRHGNSALVYAYEFEDSSIIRFLDGCQSSRAGIVEYELIRCASQGEIEKVVSSLEAGANPNHIFNRTALCAAAEAGCFEVVKYLLASGAHPDLRPSAQDFTPLIAAAYNGHDAVVRLLLEQGANPQCEVEDMGTAIDYARLGEEEGLVPSAPWKEILASLSS